MDVRLRSALYVYMCVLCRAVSCCVMYVLLSWCPSFLRLAVRACKPGRGGRPIDVPKEASKYLGKTNVCLLTLPRTSFYFDSNSFYFLLLISSDPCRSRHGTYSDTRQPLSSFIQNKTLLHFLRREAAHSTCAPSPSANYKGRSGRPVMHVHIHKNNTTTNTGATPPIYMPTHSTNGAVATSISRGPPRVASAYARPSISRARRTLRKLTDRLGLN